MFIDYLSMWQQHDPCLGDYLGGRVISIEGACGLSRKAVVDDDGVYSDSWAIDGGDIDYTVGKFKQVSGSYETSLFIRMISGRVEVRGNPSAYGRLDNVFGLSLDDCVAVYNKILTDIGLPTFTDGVVKSRVKNSRATTHQIESVYSGAHITRADCTINLSVGFGKVRQFNQWCAQQKIYRTSPDDSELERFKRWDYSTVYLSDSKYWIGAKVYDKAEALMQRSYNEYKRKLKANLNAGEITESHYFERLSEAEKYITELAQWCAEVGLSRLEYSFKNRFFTQNLEAKFYKKNVSELLLFNCARDEMNKLLDRAVVIQESKLLDLTAAEFKFYSLWKSGVNLSEMLTKSTFYRHRAAILKKIGCDIAARPLENQSSDFRPVYFKIQPLSVSSVPPFYRQASLDLALAA